MASAAENSTYTLYGFGNDLDWRRTCFLEPLPRSRYCTYCGRVCATMMVLPCCHIVCAGCYSQCTKRSYTCVLDAQSFQQHDVAVMLYSSQDLASKHIRCWNAAHGCKITGLSFQILEHYQKHCAHHVITCSRCNQAVSHGDVVTHLASGCSQEPVMLLDVQDTRKDFERQSLADSRHLGTDSHFSLTNDQSENLELENDCSSSIALPLAGQYCVMNILPQPLSGYSGKQAPAYKAYDPVAHYLSEEPPHAVCTEFLVDPSCITHCNDSLAKRKIPTSLELEITGRPECLTELNFDFIQEQSLQMQETSSDSASTSPETALLGSYRRLPATTMLQAGTLSRPELNSTTVAASGAKGSNAATVRVDHEYLCTGNAVVTQDTGKIEEHNSSTDRPALTKKYTLPQYKDEGNSRLMGHVENETMQAAPSTSSNINSETLPSLVHRYVNSVCRFMSTTLTGTDAAKEALSKLKPEDLVFILKASEEIRAQMNAEGTALTATCDEERELIRKVFQAAREQSMGSGDDVFSQDHIAQKIDNLINLLKLVLRQHIQASVPVQWNLHGWSELKARALAAGQATDYFPNISTTFYGYAIVPGLLLENTTGTLRLHFSFYIKRGVYDSFLEWPVKKELTLSIIHPTDKGKVRFLTVDTTKGQVDGCTKPENETGQPVSRAKSIKADYFDMNGYVDGNKLLLKLEVK